MTDFVRAESFYTELLGFKVTDRVGNKYVFLTVGRRHHDVALQNVGTGAPVTTPRSVGLYHFAIELEDLPALVEAFRILQAAKVPIQVANHGISIPLYFADPVVTASSCT